MDDSRIDHHLDQQPLNQAVGSVSRLGVLPNGNNELGSVNGSIEERFRRLKAATVRAGLSQRWLGMRNSNETGGPSTESMIDVERGNGCKRESSLLVAKALEMECEVPKVHEDDGNFYDCNICLRVAREPILTCCGHLFCWACFYELPYVDSIAKECPACEGEVTDSDIIPIYGNGDSIRESKLESGKTIPLRPKAQRVESARQQGTHRIRLQVVEAFRRVRARNRVMEDHPQQEESSGIALRLFGNNSPNL
ncbi:hypothetical protein ACH5RR_000657 [Cinchona calisaya]|uniref:E3 ubiquitin-protein ligase RMA n=1 Tax=Cinchona calisaya TaxID=153742 RepID=A0ABD3B1R8_9GENT